LDRDMLTPSVVHHLRGNARGDLIAAVA
jgi:hypothetical protein